MIIPYGVIQRNVISFLVLFCSAINYHGAVSNYENEIEPTMESVVVVEGLIAKLPCDITPSFRGDRIHIVIWYKKSNNGKLTPIYTFDSRDNLLLEQGKHWLDELVLGGRANFRFKDEPAKLVINSILRNDAGVYQCRVDFKQSPTRSSEVNLTVIVPPNELTILNEKGFQVTDSYLGPYKEGSSVNVTCICTGGFPTPKVTWWQENALLDESYENLSENIVRNVLYIERLERKHLDVALTCQASNNYVIAPISTSKKLDINLRPVSVKLLGENKPLSVGKSYQLKCEVIGSRPVATISWWKGGTKLGGKPATVNTNGNVTISTVNFTPTLNDEGKYISCIVEQPLISSDIIETRWKLNIHHVPLVSLELSNKLSSSTIEEGRDVYFECNVKSNPWVYKLSWKYNGKILYSNRAQGIIINNQSLVLQDVNRDRSGNYSCIGSNQEGDGESNVIELEITFSPICRTKEIVTYEVSLYETIKINCEVEANPAAVEFIWELNNTEIPSHLISFYETSNIVSYTPLTENDYGTLSCMASNVVGKQHESCLFHITFIDKPNPLSNCFLLNQTHQSLIVKCVQQRLDVNQTFVAEVYDIQTRKLLKNISSETPTFIIIGLIPSQEIEINLFAVSPKGKSKPTRLKAFVPKLEETLAASVPVKLYITPKLSITICTVLVVMFTTVVILTACRLCGKGKHNNKKCNNRGPSSPISRFAEEDNIENTNPDIIPLRKGKGQDEEGFVDELLQNSSSETYIKLESPEEINAKFTRSEPPLRYINKLQPAIRYDPVSLRHPEARQFLQQHRVPNHKVYGTGVDPDLSTSIPEELLPLHFQRNRNEQQPLITKTPRITFPEHHMKVTQI